MAEKMKDDVRNRQERIDQANAEFWNELCGTALAQALGIEDNSEKSLAILDRWYLDYYSYLLKMVDYENIRGQKVLEVGLGYGTLGQKLAEAASDYTGMDIAEGPVAMMNRRLATKGLQGRAIQGSIHRSPFANETFDAVVSIGCFHHTGSVQRCVDETYRILRRRGRAFVMVYNQFSYRQWENWPARTFSALLRDYGLRQAPLAASSRQKAAYDSDTKGQEAPETEFCSIRALRKMFQKFAMVNITKANCTDRRFLGRSISRRRLLPILGRHLGLDLYLQATKG